MTISNIQYAKNKDQAYNKDLNVVVTLSSNITDSSHLLIAIIGYSGGCTAVNTVSSNNCTWSKVASHEGLIEYGPNLVEIWKGVLGSGIYGKIVTVNWHSNSVTYHAGVAHVAEYAGLSGVTESDAGLNATVLGTTVKSGTGATTTQNAELWISSHSAKAHAINTTSITHSDQTNNFSIVSQDYILCVSWGWGGSCCYLEKIVSATGQPDVNTTVSVSSDWNGVVIAFKGSVIINNISITETTIVITDALAPQTSRPISEAVVTVTDILALQANRLITEGTVTVPTETLLRILNRVFSISETPISISDIVEILKTIKTTIPYWVLQHGLFTLRKKRLSEEEQMKLQLYYLEVLGMLVNLEESE